MKAQKIDPKIIRITHILQQVQNLNGMIALHRDKSQDGFMLRQYEYMRGEFLKELKGLLEGLGVGAGNRLPQFQQPSALKKCLRLFAPAIEMWKTMRQK